MTAFADWLAITLWLASGVVLGAISIPFVWIGGLFT